jgi:hypothetical protein
MTQIHADNKLRILLLPHLREGKSKAWIAC